MNKAIDFTNSKLGQLMVKLSVPAFFAIVMNLLYGFVDGIIIGDGINSNALGGVSIVFPLIFMTNAFASTLGEGMASIVARLIAKGEHEDVKATIRTAHVATWWFAVILAILTTIFVIPLMDIMGATSDIHGYAVNYYRALVIGLPFMGLSLVYFHQLNAHGEMRIAMRAMIISTVLNIFLDYIGIYVLRWGVASAGYATAVSQLVWFGYMHINAVRSSHVHTILHPFSFKISFKKLGEMVVIGIGTFIRQFGVGIALIFMNSLASVYGSGVHITAFGATQRILRLFIAPIAAINTALKPIIGQNYGYGAYDRVKKALKYAAYSGLAAGAVLFIVVYVFRSGLGRMFGIPESDIGVFVNVLLITMALFPFYGIWQMTVSYFVATGKAGQAILLNLLKQLIVLIPLVILLPMIFGVYGIYMAIPLADLMTIGIALMLLRKDIKQLYVV